MAGFATIGCVRDEPATRGRVCPYANDAEIEVWQAARILHLSVATVRRMIRTGELVAWPARPGGRKRLLWEQQVLELKAAQQRRAVEESQLLQMEFEF